MYPCQKCMVKNIQQKHSERRNSEIFMGCCELVDLMYRHEVYGLEMVNIPRSKLIEIVRELIIKEICGACKYNE